MHAVLSRGPDGVPVLTRTATPGPEASSPTAVADLPATVAALDVAEQPRWTWDDTTAWYPGLLAAGVRVDRAHDLRLAHRILRSSALAAGSALAAAPPGPWDAPPAAVDPEVPVGTVRRPQSESLFDLGPERPRTRHEAEPASRPDPVAELAAQQDAVEGAAAPGRLRLLVAAESAGALVAAEMRHAGFPWRADVHDQILTDTLGPRPPEGARPARLESLVGEIRAALDAPPTLNPDSHPDLLRAMEYAGVGARSLRKWELERLDHPVVAPLLEYKNLYRLWTANGWHWLDQWVTDGRFRTDYVVGGVVTGRWSSTGGGALQLPKAVRRAAQADPGWVLVVADAAQLEPRVLTAMSRDEAMAAAGQHGDLYAGIVASGAVESREHAKVGMLGAMYGGTTGVSGIVLPRLTRAFPRAMGLVEDAARTGERGGVVTTWLGRSSPPPGQAWEAVQAGALDDGAAADAASTARSSARSWGRFTRNFVVQGTAAEWALCWLASIRRGLWELGTSSSPGLGPAPFADRPHLAFFLHDEVVVHAPAAMADDVARVVREAAAEAGRLLFGDFPVEFPLTVATVDSYADAK
ncbi:DNA polymerase-1 [Isoptericola jiangsuensis]|uniref:DNA-directed DNA polymerase n=1 Tax=Isoptericola jiangsuensis TaxID=548579 RepID=A0A2A9EZ20_9MICO|nr:bifunctional 3'-5' exonuclease/DNA polymerase [Isoptericola jiangsuensis]PFG43552.1 DNA polymerase-1 [Isoptericola jiangsuensis]